MHIHAIPIKMFHQSTFARGDVDFFIQPGMLVSQYKQHFVEKLNGNLFKEILKFVDPNPDGVLGTNCGSDHINSYFRSLINKELSKAYEYAANILEEYDYQGEFAENIMTVSSRACTNEFVSVVEARGDISGNCCKPIELWPRTTQAIQLKRRYSSVGTYGL